jgi:iodotyrosine deiodinase
LNSKETAHILFQELASKVDFDAYYETILARRSIRFFSSKEVEEHKILKIIEIANSAPSGANKQPWHFALIKSQDLKAKIREAAEKEEYINYNSRMSEEWKEELKQFGTDWQKDFITTAPYIIVMFKKAYDLEKSGQKSKNYYVSESAGIAAGFLIAAIQVAGLVTLTHTPSPMNFLQEILERPENEKAFLLLPVGYPAENATVPNIKKKTIQETLSIY